MSDLGKASNLGKVNDLGKAYDFVKVSNFGKVSDFNKVSNLRKACDFEKVSDLEKAMYVVVGHCTLENWQSVVQYRLQATGENDLLNNVFTCCILALFRILDLLVCKQQACTVQF